MKLIRKGKKAYISKEFINCLKLMVMVKLNKSSQHTVTKSYKL